MQSKVSSDATPKITMSQVNAELLNQLRSASTDEDNDTGHKLSQLLGKRARRDCEEENVLSSYGNNTTPENFDEEGGSDEGDKRERR